MSFAEKPQTSPDLSAQITSWQVITVVTFNVWFGLRERGVLRMKPLESRERRERRYRILLGELRQRQPDFIALQEANPVRRYARRLAADLGYDEIHQVYNGGVKIGPAGIPINLQMGLVLLAKRQFQLRWAGSRQISGDRLGIYHDNLCLHFTDSRFVMAGSASIGGKRLFLVHTHTYAGPSQHPEIFDLLRRCREQGEITEGGYQNHVSRLERIACRQHDEIDRILHFLRSTCGDHPAVLLGDFNLSEDDPILVHLIKEGHLWDTYQIANPDKKGDTWDSTSNENTAFFGGLVSERSGTMDIRSRLRAEYDRISRRIDYIFLNSVFRKDQILESSLVFEHAVDGLHASDHYGVMTRVRIES